MVKLFSSALFLPKVKQMKSKSCTKRVKVHGNFHVPKYMERYMEISMYLAIERMARHMEISMYLAA